MKKVIMLLMALMLCLSMGACSSKKDGGETAPATDPAPTAEPTPTPDPMEKYVGKYLVVSIKDEEGDIAEQLKQTWESRYFYEWCEIDEEGIFKLYIYQEGEGKRDYTENIEIRFDPENQTISQGDEVIHLQFEGYDRFIWELSSGNVLTFERNDEIPD